jgi:hypothetical protein
MSDPHHPDIAGYLLGIADAEEQQAFEAHLAACEICQADVDELADVVGLLGEAPPAHEPPPPSLRVATLAAVERAAAEEAPAIVPIHAGRRAKPRTVSMPRWVAVAAAVILVAATTVALQALPGGQRAASAKVVLVDPAGGPARGVAEIRTTATGREVELKIEHLPPVPGFVYECWFVADDDTMERPVRVSAGTFTTGTDRKATLHMSSSADPVRFSKMGVTLEPDDGNPQRQGVKVLVSAPPR